MNLGSQCEFGFFLYMFELKILNISYESHIMSEEKIFELQRVGLFDAVFEFVYTVRWTILSIPIYGAVCGLILWALSESDETSTEINDALTLGKFTL